MMPDPKREQQEQAWGDEIPQEDGADDAYEKTYRDGSAVNECWNSEEA